MQKQQFQWNEKCIGMDYYPEHWDRSLWEEDLERMLSVGITYIRIAEFAWSKVEPTEGGFTFEFYDEFLNLCAKKGMKVIFSTPSATPPAWLTTKYPEVLNVTIDGVPFSHGSRRHYNYNSGKYRELVSRIVEKEAEHYGKHPAIAGWQLDNEFNCEENCFYSDADRCAFRVFLQKKYGTLDELNRAWGVSFWNQYYTDWEEIPLPGHVASSRNPHQMLDYLRFISDSTIAFAKMQAEIIRKYMKPGDFITTNGMFSHLDNHALQNEALDVYTYDSYPNFAQSINLSEDSYGLKDRNWSRSLTEVRSICPHFGIMEQQAGPGGATGWNWQITPRPGQLKLWAMQSVAHGADYVGFFRWRTAAFGAEMYWHGLLNYDNRDNRRIAELKDFYKDLKKLDAFVGADYVASFALLKDYDNVFDEETDALHGRIAYESEKELFKTAQKMHLPYDVVYLNEETTIDELLKYPALIYPHPMIVSEKRISVLKTYVEQGGKLLIGSRAGYKDLEGQCRMIPMPGLFAELTGTDVVDFTIVDPKDPAYAIATEKAGEASLKRFKSAGFDEVLQVSENTDILATFENQYYKGSPALVKNAYWRGEVYHLATGFDESSVRFFMNAMKIESPAKDEFVLSESVELSVQEKNGKRVAFVLNYLGEETEIELLRDLRRIDTGIVETGKVVLPPYGVAIYEL